MQQSYQALLNEINAAIIDTELNKIPNPFLTVNDKPVKVKVKRKGK